MGGMWFVLGAVALVAVVIAAISVLRRPSAEDLSSVRHYHSALGTLEHLSERNARPTGEAAGTEATGPAGSGWSEDDGPAPGDPRPRSYRRPETGAAVPPRPRTDRLEDPLRPAPRSSRPAPAVVRPVPAETGDSLVFDDAHPQVPSDHPAAPPLSRMDRAQRHALDSMNRRPRRGMTAVLAVVAVAVLVGALALVGSHRSRPNTTNGAPARHVPPTTTPTTRPRHGQVPKTRTTAPAQLLAQSSTSNAAQYLVSSNAYRLTLSTSGPCWVNATDTTTGTALWTGTMQAGGVQQIQAAGTTRVEFGTLAVAVTVDGVPVVVPLSIHSPFALTFVPAPAIGATGPSSTTTTAPTPATSG